MTRYKVIPAKDPNLVRLSRQELEDMGTKKAKDELARRKANRQARREAKRRGGSK
jgi:hypothetical protein